MPAPAKASVLLFHKALIKEIESLLSDMEFKKTDGQIVHGVTGYEQNLPQITEDEEDISEFFPFALVKIAPGWSTKDDEDTWHATVDIIFGIFDEDTRSAAYETLVNMIEKVTNRFNYEHLLDGSYRAEPAMTTEIQDDQPYPYSYGGVEMTFTLPKIERRVVFDESYYA